MVKIARTGISTSNGHNFQTKKILNIRWCQNSRLFEGFHPLFHESVVAQLFLPFLAYMGPFLVIFLVLGVGAQGGSLAQNMPLGPLETGEQKNLLPHNFYCLWQQLL